VAGHQGARFELLSRIIAETGTGRDLIRHAQMIGAKKRSVQKGENADRNE
jgi:hypothetical protein